MKFRSVSKWNMTFWGFKWKISRRMEFLQRCSALKNEFLFKILKAIRVTLVQGKAADRLVLAGMIRKVEVSADWFGCVLVIFDVYKYLRKLSHGQVSSLFCQCIYFAAVHVNRSVILIDCLGSVTLSSLQIKGQVRLWAHLREPD